MKKFIKEFQAFISRGNVMDMAVGIIIGGAFTAIVQSLVGDIITPLIGIIIGGVNFEGICIVVGGAVLKIGVFLNAVITFLLTALALFIVIKAMNAMHRKKKEEPAAPEEPAPTPDDILLLQEIRDLLKEQNK